MHNVDSDESILIVCVCVRDYNCMNINYLNMAVIFSMRCGFSGRPSPLPIHCLGAVHWYDLVPHKELCWWLASWTSSTSSLSNMFTGLVTTCNDLMTTPPESSISLTYHLWQLHSLPQGCHQEHQHINLVLEDVQLLCHENWRDKVALAGSTLSLQKK